MGTLKYAILGLLNRKSMTGYDLSKEFETTLFEFWNAKHSQIYPELKSPKKVWSSMRLRSQEMCWKRRFILLQKKDGKIFINGKKA